MRGIAALAAGLAGLLLIARRPAPPLEPSSPFSFADNRLIVAPGSPFLKRLEIVAIGRAAEESSEFRTVGQIIALSNTSGSLTGRKVAWVELDPKLSGSLGLEFAEETARAGTAYGLTALATEYAARVRAGERVEITRYGLRKSPVSGTVAKVIPREEGDRIDVVFRLGQAQDFFPGTNCEVFFPLLRGHAVRIPTTAPVHEGSQEYVWKEVGPGQFAAQNVSLVDATPEEVSVLGLRPGDRIITRGAILLKPLLAPLLARKKG